MIASHGFPDHCLACYSQSYFEALGLVVNAIGGRFKQPDFNSCGRLEKLLMPTISDDSTEGSFDFVTNFIVMISTVLKTNLRNTMK